MHTFYKLGGICFNVWRLRFSRICRGFHCKTQWNPSFPYMNMGHHHTYWPRSIKRHGDVCAHSGVYSCHSVNCNPGERQHKLLFELPLSVKGCLWFCVSGEWGRRGWFLPPACFVPIPNWYSSLVGILDSCCCTNPLPLHLSLFQSIISLGFKALDGQLKIIYKPGSSLEKQKTQNLKTKGQVSTVQHEHSLYVGL